MALPSSALCELWEQLCRLEMKDTTAVVRQWFERHASNISRQGPAGLALLSCLFPHKRPDRIYGLRDKKLTGITVKAWGLGTGRRNELQRLQDTDDFDFASALQRLVEDGGDRLQSQHSPTVEVVDQTLNRVASTCTFSSPEIRNRFKAKPVEPSQELMGIFRQMSGLEVKWMTRLLLKDLGPVHLPEMVTMQLFHTALPRVLEVRRSLAGALELLTPLLPEQEPGSTCVMQPQLETMISLPVFEKARSIRHCCQLVGDQEISVERKYDGEYCQVHVRAGTAGDSCVTIYSKSGRNSTTDRKPLLPTIKSCLRLDTSDCRIQRQCILVGELLAWNDRTQKIMPFFKIRRYVTREGHHLGCAQDSPRSPDEHLMIIFYDVLVLDDINCIYEPYEYRRQRLQALVNPVPGHAEIGEREKIDFQRQDAAVRLAHRLAAAITQNWKGLVLKACHDPYVAAHGGIQRHVKLKKDYIPGLGDSADLVVVGGRRDASAVYALGLGNLSWTTFYLACVQNKNAVLAQNAKPTFRIVGEVSRPSISIENVRFLNQHEKSCQVSFSRSRLEMDVHTDLAVGKLPTSLFTRPAVVEVVGAGFDRPPNSRYHTLRFPRVLKIHFDRTVVDATDSTAYQLIAEQSRFSNGYGAGESYELWLNKLGIDDLVGESCVRTSLETSQNTQRTSLSPVAGPCSDKEFDPGGTRHHSGNITKRMASDVSDQNDTRKRTRHQNQATAPSKHDHILATDHDSQPIEIEETQLSARHSQSERTNRDDPRSDIVQVSMPLLVHPSLQGSICTSRTGFADALSTCPVEMTFNSELFRDCVLQRKKHPSPDCQPTEHTYLVLVGWNYDSAVASALGFLSLAMSRMQELLEVCPPCKILFAEWNIVMLLAPEMKGQVDRFRKHVKAFLATHHGTVTLGSGMGM